MIASLESLLDEAESLYDDGQLEKALLLYQKAAEQDHTQSQLLLGWHCFHGEGVPKDEAKGVYWWKRAADAGSAKAEFYLGAIECRKKNYEEGFKNYLSAADKGYSPAMYRVGREYELGRSVPADLNKALFFYNKSARAGNIFGMKGVSRLLVRGQKGLIGRVHGIYFFLKALILGIYNVHKNPNSDNIQD